MRKVKILAQGWEEWGVGGAAAYNPKAERKKTLLSSIVISAIQASKVFQNPVFLSFILSLCTTGNKGHFFKGKL